MQEILRIYLQQSLGVVSRHVWSMQGLGYVEAQVMNGLSRGTLHCSPRPGWIRPLITHCFHRTYVFGRGMEDSDITVGIPSLSSKDETVMLSHPLALRWYCMYIETLVANCTVSLQRRCGKRGIETEQEEHVTVSAFLGANNLHNTIFVPGQTDRYAGAGITQWEEVFKPLNVAKPTSRFYYAHVCILYACICRQKPLHFSIMALVDRRVSM